MKIIRPSLEIIDNINGSEILKKIDRIGHICYMPGVKYFDDRSLLEHISLTVRFICNMGVLHKLKEYEVCYSQKLYNENFLSFVMPYYLLDENRKKLYNRIRYMGKCNAIRRR